MAICPGLLRLNQKTLLLFLSVLAVCASLDTVWCQDTGFYCQEDKCLALEWNTHSLSKLRLWCASLRLELWCDSAIQLFRHFVFIFFAIFTCWNWSLCAFHLLREMFILSNNVWFGKCKDNLNGRYWNPGVFLPPGPRSIAFLPQQSYSHAPSSFFPSGPMNPGFFSALRLSFDTRRRARPLYILVVRLVI